MQVSFSSRGLNRLKIFSTNLESRMSSKAGRQRLVSVGELPFPPCVLSLGISFRTSIMHLARTFGMAAPGTTARQANHLCHQIPSGLASPRGKPWPSCLQLYRAIDSGP